MTVTGKLVHPQTMGSKHIDSNGNVGIGTAHTVSTDRLNKFVTKKFHWKALTPSDQLAMAEEILEWRAMSDGR